MRGAPSRFPSMFDGCVSQMCIRKTARPGETRTGYAAEDRFVLVHTSVGEDEVTFTVRHDMHQCEEGMLDGLAKFDERLARAGIRPLE